LNVNDINNKDITKMEKIHPLVERPAVQAALKLKTVTYDRVQYNNPASPH
jgi:hypothetical protein